MLGHDFIDMPGQLEDLVLRCKWCMKTPTKAREDGCAVREIKTAGRIRLYEWNPAGVEYFKDRVCVTCENPIMWHFLHDESPEYWCPGWVDTFSEGINDCKHDVSNVQAPAEQTEPRRPFSMYMRMGDDPAATITPRGDQNE